MSNETIMLAKNLNLKKMQYPCSATEKLDGVPGKYTAGMRFNEVFASTRQGEPILSTEHIKDWLFDKLPSGHSVIGELHIPGLVFKDISGLVRRAETCSELVLNVFDYVIAGEPNMSYADRMEAMVMSEVGKYIYDEMDGPVRVIPGKHIANEQELLKYCAEFTKLNPNAEGLIFRPLHGEISEYAQGKRSWGLQRYKAEETVDLRVMGVHEAIDSKTGKGNGMVGRIVCDYKGTEIGVGPGALTHAERIDWFHNQKDYLFNIIEVAYKPDPSYDALREARFKRFRHDKIEPNIE
jgi:ATP-dependent DNA ligase